MPLTRRAGFTLVEMLTALVVSGLVGLVLVRSTLAIQRTAHASEEGMSLQAAFDGGLGFLAMELAEVGRGNGVADLLRVAPDSLSYRGVRGTGIACRIDATGVTIPLNWLRSTRAPQPGRDSLLVFVGVDSLLRRSDGWLALPLLGVGSATCGGGPALRLVTLVDTNATPLGGLPPLLPVRLFEAMQARFYPSLGAWWLGARSESAGETIQPLAGPFIGGGVGFSFRDSLQQPTQVPGAVQAMDISIVGRWSGWAGGSSSRADSVHRTLLPRNLAP